MIAFLRRLWRRDAKGKAEDRSRQPTDCRWVSGEEPDAWDEQLAQELVGSLVLVGLTRLDPAGGLWSTNSSTGM